jgi:pseudouridine synthase
VIRLQKALADRGVASRRRAEELIAAGRVRVDGEAVITLGTKVPPDARIDVDGIATQKAQPRYVLLNKPKGIVSTAHDERRRKTVVDVVGASERLYPVGRLDTDSEGMVLLTNDGEWAERVLHPRFGHEREYDVSVTGELTPDGLAQLRNGIRLEEGLAVAARIDVRSRSRNASRITMVLHTGWRRQIRRMLSAVGLRTVRLVRVRVGSLPLGRLREGEWRELTTKEIADLARPAEKRAAAGRSKAATASSGHAPTSPVAAPKPSLRAEPRRLRATGTPRARGPSAARPTPRPAAPRDARGPRPSSRADVPRGPARRPASSQVSAPQRVPRPTERPPMSAPAMGPSGSRARRTMLSQPTAAPATRRDFRGPGRGPAAGGRSMGSRSTGARPQGRGPSGPVRRASQPLRAGSRTSAPSRGPRSGGMPPRAPSRPARRPPAPYGVRRGPVRAKVTR